MNLAVSSSMVSFWTFSLDETLEFVHEVNMLTPFWPVVASVVVMPRLEEGVPESTTQLFAFYLCATRWE